jgi:F-type H+-transporting ATPase subunit epsilon
VLAESAELSDEIDVEEAKAALSDEDETERARAAARLRAAGQSV